jgi:beta-N-acetylhexosaminidase
MHAVTDYYNSGDAAVTSILAGADMILMPADFDSAYAGVLGAVYDGRITMDRLNESVRRILSVKLR